MSEKNVQYLTEEKLADFKEELQKLKEKKVPELAKRIDDARQMGDLSENAEYQTAREEMAWTMSRIKELNNIIDNAQVFETKTGDSGVVQVGSTVVADAKGTKKEYTIVGAQEADPSSGRISNESPLGEAFLGHAQGDTVEVEVPSGKQSYKILEVK